MPGGLTHVEFRLFPDNHQLPPLFVHNGVDFGLIDAAARAPFVNDTGGDRGLQFPRSGLRVRFAGPTNSVLVVAGGFGEPIEINALGMLGQTLLTLRVLPGNQYVRSMVHAPSIHAIELVAGGDEGILTDLVLPICG